MSKIDLSYRELKDPEYAEVIKRKHEFYNCQECLSYMPREGTTGLCTHPDTQELRQTTHPTCPFKIKKGGLDENRDTTTK
jgi:hypothetical protein